MKGKIKKAMVAAITLFSVLFIFSNPTWADGTIIDEWAGVKAPAAPELKPVSVDPSLYSVGSQNQESDHKGKSQRDTHSLQPHQQGNQGNDTERGDSS